MAYTPVELTKDGKTVTTSNSAEEVELLYDGWLPTGRGAPAREDYVTSVNIRHIVTISDADFAALPQEDPTVLYITTG